MMGDGTKSGKQVQYQESRTFVGDLAMIVCPLESIYSEGVWKLMPTALCAVRITRLPSIF